ncbi:MAG: hypothetical protein WDM84_05265 [Bauldia sp.]
MQPAATLDEPERQMNTIGRVTAVALLALATVAGPALANDHGNDSFKDPMTDNTGLSSLGIDIDPAGNNLDSLRAFLATLRPDQQRGLFNGCRYELDHSGDSNLNVLSFCKRLSEVGKS